MSAPPDSAVLDLEFALEEVDLQQHQQSTVVQDDTENYHSRKMSGSDEREFDVVIFGASGFTGKYTVEYVTKINDEHHLKWAIAGRNRNKLAAVLDEVTQITGKDVKNIPIIIADVDDQNSLNEMCKRTKMVLNVVGPYRLYGEPVVKACIENRAHHLDLSGEPSFLEGMQLKYNEEAKKAGVYILGTTGFDSIPCESGIQVLREKIGGDLNSVESIIEFKHGPSKSKLNSGTWKSAVYGFPNAKELRPIRKQIFNNPNRVPKSSHPLKRRFPIFYNSQLSKWCVTFPITDKSVVNRTNHYNYNYRQMRPVQIYTYLVLESIFLVFPLLFIALMFGLFSLTRFGRYLLERYPSFFSLGLFSDEGPSRQQVEETSFVMYLLGEGYQEKLTDPNSQHNRSPKKKMTLAVEGPEPGYVTTPICMVQTALTVLQEQDKMPDGGGVLTPGAALLNTTLIPRLEKAGIKYRVLNN